ncbi:MAG TPA: DUF1684 domain-containing protein [Pseudonocardiaceae bacterium]|nr:DUF1684 domain-containing protein [Pseudonocardiaceae bacterium]
MTARLELTDYRRQVGELYAAVRAETDPAQGHAVWRAGRDELFRNHPQSPLPADDPLRKSGLPYWPYNPALRFTLPLLPSGPTRLALPTDNGGSTAMTLVGHVEPLGTTVDVWWLEQYAGGLFVPLRDGSAGHTSYGGGRYLLDTAKSADLGGTADHLVVDLNFLYHPSCRYDAAWQCPLAPPGNTISAVVEAGERM